MASVTIDIGPGTLRGELPAPLPRASPRSEPQEKSAPELLRAYEAYWPPAIRSALNGGRVGVVTVRIAMKLVTEPTAFDTVTSIWAPLSAAAAMKLNVSLFAPMAAPFLRHA